MARKRFFAPPSVELLLIAAISVTIPNTSLLFSDRCILCECRHWLHRFASLAEHRRGRQSVCFTRLLPLHIRSFVFNRNLWRLYGWLTGLICFASCAGIVHVAAMIVFFEGLYKRPDQSSDNRILEATASIFLVGGTHRCCALLLC